MYISDEQACYGDSCYGDSCYGDPFLRIIISSQNISKERLLACILCTNADRLQDL